MFVYALLLFGTAAILKVESCDVIIRLSSDDRVVLVDRITEEYHTCLKCPDNLGQIDPATIWELRINGVELMNDAAFENINGTLLILNSTKVIARDGRDVDITANCYTPDRSINHTVLLYSDAFLPPTVQSFMIKKRRGETVMLSCTNNNPPTLASEIRWVQDNTVLQTLSLTNETMTNTVVYTTEANESGVYQCQVFSARNNTLLLVVDVTLTVDGDSGGTSAKHPYMLEFILLHILLPIFLFCNFK